MFTKNDRIACDYCGKFISIAALESGAAVHHMVTPDSHLSREEYESYHRSCEPRSHQQSQEGSR